MTLRRHSQFAAVLAGVALIALVQQRAWANCYATSLGVSATGPTTTTLQYLLNETAHGASGNPAVTLNIYKASDNSLVKTVTSPTIGSTAGLQTYVWDRTDNSSNPVPQTSYYFKVTTWDTGHSATPWDQIQAPPPDTTSPNTTFGSPRGVAVNRNPNSKYYGRIYVTNTTLSGGVQGVYMRNADTSDSPIGQGNTARTGGVTFGASASSPFRLTIGSDDQLYITDFSNANGGLFVADPDVVTTSQVLSGVGGGSAFIGSSHGAISAAVPTGTLAGGNLKMYSMDQDHGGSGKFQSVWRYDIGGGPLPWSAQPTQEITNYVYTFPYTGTLTGTYSSTFITTVEGVGVGDDMDIAPDGKIFVVEDRAAGTESGLLVFSADTGSGQSTILYDSLFDTRNNIAVNTTAVDTLLLVVAIAVSPDGTNLAVLTTTNVILIPLFTSGPNQGLPNLAARTTIVGTFTANGRDVCWDAVGNLYVVASGTARLRVYSPPAGINNATTQSPSNFLVGGPVISTQPQNLNACNGATLTPAFSIVATGTGTLHYQWYRNGSIMTGETNSTLNLVVGSATAQNSDFYRCDVTDNLGTTSSNNATLTITAVPTLTINTYDQTIRPGGTATFSVTGASNATPSTLAFQWYQGSPSDTTHPLTNGTPTAAGTTVSIVSTATTSTLTLGNVQRADARALNSDSSTQGTYYCSVSDSCTNVVNSAAGVLALTFKICNNPFSDTNGDGLVDMNDFGLFQRCYTAATGVFDPVNCGCIDTAPAAAPDRLIDVNDLAAMQAAGLDLAGGHAKPAAPFAGPTTFFTDDFETNDSASWTANVSVGTLGVNHFATFAYDYTANMGIPLAPHSAAGASKGVKLEADVTGNVGGGVSISPTGLNLSGNYTLEFDMWVNYALNIGKVGTSQYVNAGIMSSGTSANLPGTVDGMVFSTIVDGDLAFNSASGSWLACTPGTATGYPNTAHAVYAANVTDSGGAFNREPSHKYYSGFFPGFTNLTTVLANQIAIFPSQGPTGGTESSSFPGIVAFAWRDVKIVKTGDWVLWFIDGHLIATVPWSGETTGGGDILFGMSDFNASSTTETNHLICMIIDNVKVTRDYPSTPQTP